VTACPNCGEKVPEQARFCSNCGAQLQQGEVREERRVVTVLFADLVGFTARSDRADPEDVRALLLPFHAGLKETIERFGGTVDKFIGDAVLGVFGAPTAHEDDPERGVRAAIAILSAVERLNRSNSDLDIAVRIGMNTGEAAVTFSSGPVIGEALAGDVVNTASRLEGIAPVGGIVVGEATQRASSRSIEYEELEPVQVKGKADPIPVWRVVGLRDEASATEQQRRVETFVGRVQELAELQTLWEAVVSERAGRLVTLVGAPGIGKTRLVGQLQRVLPGRVRWLQGACLPYGEGVTFWALREIMSNLAGIAEGDDRTVVAGKLRAAIESLVSEPGDVGWLAGRLEPLFGVEDAQGGRLDRGELFTAWRRVLEELADGAPLVLVVEDVHWAADSMLEFLEFVADPPLAAPILVLCTARPEFLERVAARGRTFSTILRIEQLSRDETSALVRALLGTPVLASEVRERLLERAGGNPLYAEQFVGMLADRSDPGQEATVEMPFPDSIQALVAARLDTLAEAERSVVHDAAVIGRSFWAGAVADLGGLDHQAADRLLRELADKDFVRPSAGSSIPGQSEFEFVHAVLCEVAAGRIPRLTRARKHRAIAEWLEREDPNARSDRAESIAFHYEEAIRLARASRMSDEADAMRPKASSFMELGGDRAMTLDVRLAEELFSKALDLQPADDPRRFELLFRLGSAMHHTGRLADSVAVLSRAIETAERGGDQIGVARARTRLSVVLWFRGDTARAEEMLVEAVTALEELDAPEVLTSAYTEMAGSRLMAGHSEEALGWADKALVLGRQLDLPNLLAKALDYRGLARCDLGDLEGVEDLREALAIARELGATRDVTVLLSNIAGLRWAMEGPVAALETFDEALDLARRRGMVGTVKWLQGNMLQPLFELGRWDEVVRVAEEVADWGRFDESEYAVVYALLSEAYLFLSRGDRERAQPLVAAFLDRARDIGDPQLLLGALATAAVEAHEAGRSAEAVALVVEAESQATERPSWDLPPQLPDLVRVACANDALELAERLVAGHSETVPELHRSCILVAQALLDEAAHRYEPAGEGFARAARGFEVLGNVFERAHAQLGAARCLAALGRASDADDMAAAALSTFRGLGAVPLAEQAEALLRVA
jgi:class 3 adenylate cyclase/tetratricopeptide (TPR) repeat protein